MTNQQPHQTEEQEQPAKKTLVDKLIACMVGNRDKTPPCYDCNMGEDLLDAPKEE